MKHLTSLLLVTLFAWILTVSAVPSKINCCSGAIAYDNLVLDETIVKFNEFFDEVIKQAKCEFALIDTNCAGIIPRAQITYQTNLNTMKTDELLALALDTPNVGLKKYISIVLTMESIKLVALYGKEMDKYNPGNTTKMQYATNCAQNAAAYRAVTIATPTGGAHTSIRLAIPVIFSALKSKYLKMYALLLSDTRCLTLVDEDKVIIGTNVISGSRTVMNTVYDKLKTTTNFALQNVVDYFITYELFRLFLKHTNDLTEPPLIGHAIATDIYSNADLKDARETLDKQLFREANNLPDDDEKDGNIVEDTKKGEKDDGEKDDGEKDDGEKDDDEEEESGQNGLGIGLLLLSTVFAVAFM